jgi:PiT family inorganic phosphate transporter
VSLLVLTALMFAFVVGANDGAALLGANLTGKAIRPLLGALVTAAAIVIVPAFLGTPVADTLAHGLVMFDAPEGPHALLIAVIVTIGIVLVSSRLGLPTSVTQALTGAMIGAAFGAGLAIDLVGAARVLLALALVPLMTGAAALVVTVVIVRMRMPSHVGDHLRRLHMVGYVVASTAYAANDAQKLHAVAAIALGTTPGRLGIAITSLLAMLFAAGTLFGVRGMALRFRRLLPGRPMNTVIADYSAGLSVLASATVGAPVSMSHATAAGLVGSAAVLDTYRRVRWDQALRIGATWVTTLPAAMVISAVAATKLR